MPEHQDPYYTGRNMYLRSLQDSYSRNGTRVFIWKRRNKRVLTQRTGVPQEYGQESTIVLVHKVRVLRTCQYMQVQYPYYSRTVMVRQEEYLKTTTGSTVRNDTYLPRRSVVPVVYEILLKYWSTTKLSYASCIYGDFGNIRKFRISVPSDTSVPWRTNGKSIKATTRV